MLTQIALAAFALAVLTGCLHLLSRPQPQPKPRVRTDAEALQALQALQARHDASTRAFYADLETRRLSGAAIRAARAAQPTPTPKAVAITKAAPKPAAAKQPRRAPAALAKDQRTADQLAARIAAAHIYAPTTPRDPQVPRTFRVRNQK